MKIEQYAQEIAKHFRYIKGELQCDDAKWALLAAADPLVNAEIHTLLTWVNSGMPRVVLSHQLAASMCSSDVGDEPIQDPWPTWCVQVPPGLLSHHVSYVFVHRLLNAQCTHFMLAKAWDTTHHTGYGLVELSLNDLANDHSTVSTISGGISVDDAEQRMLMASARLVIGCARELETPRPSDYIRPLGVKYTRNAQNQVVETNTGYMLTRDVKVDCRSYVKDYLAGNLEKVPTVRWLTRGHWQRYATGPGRTERTWKHKEPFWNGPTTAPIAVRSHVLADKVTP